MAVNESRIYHRVVLNIRIQLSELLLDIMLQKKDFAFLRTQKEALNDIINTDEAFAHNQ